jgi:hypothetical protein
MDAWHALALGSLRRSPAPTITARLHLWPIVQALWPVGHSLLMFGEMETLHVAVVYKTT